VNELPPPSDPAPGAAAPAAATSAVPAVGPGFARWWIATAVLMVMVFVSAGLSWKAEQRVASVEQELVRRQQESATQSAEAHMMARQAQEATRDSTAKVALLEARLAEVSVQRGQLEELIQSLSRSRDENLIVDIEAAIRVALQQNAITGSAEPLVSTLKQSDERLARYSLPRLDGVRRAIVRDLDRVKAASVVDISSLMIKLDEAIRLVDELPLLATADLRRDAAKPVAATPPARGASTPSAAPSLWPSAWTHALSTWWDTAWAEVRSLVRVTRIDNPSAALIAPEQAYFLKENLKLRLLNARLALLSRQFDTAQADLRESQLVLDRYFDRSSRRTAMATDLVRQVAQQARQVGVPRPDDTLAALAAAAAGR
jgi:uroporphyrin-3 C-methyltransferase